MLEAVGHRLVYFVLFQAGRPFRVAGVGKESLSTEALPMGWQT